VKNRSIIAALALTGVAALLASPAIAGAQADDDDLLPAIAASGSPLVSVDLHGTARARGHAFGNASLGNGTSGAQRPIGATAVNAGNPSGDATDTLALGDLRFRFTPTMHVGSRASVHGQFDLTGAAFAIGSTERDHTVLDRTLGLPGSGGKRGGLFVRRLWGEFDVLGLATIQLGRMGDHFGLGILRNDGRDRRVDFQSDIDRVGVRAELLGFRLALARDVMASLPFVHRGLANHTLGTTSQDTTSGLLNGGDVIRWLAQVESGAAAGPGFGWGAAVSWQSQDVALALEHDGEITDKLAANCVAKGSCLQVEPRGANLLWPQAYARFERKTGFGVLRAEGEVALLLGTLDNTDTLAATDTSKTLIAGGFAAKASLAAGKTAYKLGLGGASGDNEGGFGVFDQANLTVNKGGERVHRSLVTGFRFHRGFVVDSLLFREVIGAIANTWYVRPALRYRSKGVSAVDGFWVEVGCLAAAAFATGSTPGRSRMLGIEPDVLIGWDLSAKHGALVHGTFLAPGAGFDAGEGGTPPSNAWRILLEWHLRF
jgi:uncharacterized protein (TIGR04551 family)